VGTDQLAWAVTLGYGDGPSDNPFAPSGHLEGSVEDLIEPALVAASTAWAAIRSDDDAVPTPFPQGTFPAPIAAGACALDAAGHAWDIAITELRQPLPDRARQLGDVHHGCGVYRENGSKTNRPI
jgi:hypothetical protein